MVYTLQRKIIYIEGIGDVIISKQKNNKRMCLRVTPKQIRVTMPYYYSFKDGERFVIRKKEWIRNVISKISRQFSIVNADQINLIDGTIYIKRYENSIINFKKTDSNGLTVEIPAAITEEQIKWVENKLRLYIRKVARQYLTERTNYLANKHSLSYSNIKISSALTRWGSCSGRNQINLNYRLMFLPQYLSDYVILHELAHTTHKNHKSEFWNLLDKLVGQNARQINKELKQFRMYEML